MSCTNLDIIKYDKKELIVFKNMGNKTVNPKIFCLGDLPCL